MIVYDGPGYFDIDYDPNVEVFVIQAREPDEDALVTVTLTLDEAESVMLFVASVVNP